MLSRSVSTKMCKGMLRRTTATGMLFGGGVRFGSSCCGHHAGGGKASSSSASSGGEPEPPRFVKRHFDNPLIRVEPSDALDNVVVVYLENKPVNTLSPGLLDQLNHTLVEHAQEDSPTRGIIITSGLTNVFSAGLDFGVLHKDLRKETFFPYWSLFQEMWLLLHEHPNPVIAAIDGNCPAAGCILSMACDHRVMARGSADKTKQFRIGVTAARAGFSAPHWVAANLTHIVGSRKAEQLLATGELLTADQALECGLVDEVTADPEQALVAAHVEMERWLSMPSDPPRWIVKNHCRTPLTRMLESKAQLARDASTFFSQLQHPTVKASLGQYVESLSRSNK